MQNNTLNEKLSEVIRLNENLDNHLNLLQIKQNNHKDMLYKICYTILLPYQRNFSVSLNQYSVKELNQYIVEVMNYLNLNIINTNTLSKESLLGLHFVLMDKLTTTENLKRSYLGKWRGLGHHFPHLQQNGKVKRASICSPKKIDQEMNELIDDYNNRIKESDLSKKLEAIIHFILYSLIIIHPFDDGNGKVFRILFDILLYKNGFFPTFIKNKEKNELLLEKLIKYNTTENFDKLKLDVLDLIIKFYSNYHV